MHNASLPEKAFAQLTLTGFWVLTLLLALPVSSAAARTIIVGGDRDYPPYEYLDTQGKPAGYNVELTRAIASVMGLTVDFRFGGWSEVRNGLADGSIDILQGISYSDQRAGYLEFSPPHTIVNDAIFARRGTPPVKSLEGLRGKEVIVFRDGIMHDYLASRGLGDSLFFTDTPADALRVLASGKHDYVVTALLPGMFTIRQNRLGNVIPVATDFSSHRYCYAVRKGNEVLLARFTEGLAILKQTGEYQKIHDRWLGVLEPPKFDWAKAMRYGAAILTPLVLILAGTVLWSRTLQKRVSARTAELARESAERIKALEELKLQQDRLIQADKMASLGILVSGVGHEINNPNGLILMNMPILRDAYRDAEEILEERFQTEGDFDLGGLPYSRMREEIPRMLDEMHSGARRIKRIVDDLRDFSRKDTALMEPLDLNEVTEVALRLVEPTIRKATERFTVEYGDNLPPIRGVAQRIEQVIVNLVLNACQSLPSPAAAVTVATWGDDTGATLTISDQGSGIDPENLPHLTDPFFTTKRESGGTGLGLSVTADIVREHGGTLEFDSMPGRGTTVTLRLPALPGSDGTTTPEPRDSADGAHS